MVIFQLIDVLPLRFINTAENVQKISHEGERFIIDIKLVCSKQLQSTDSDENIPNEIRSP